MTQDKKMLSATVKDGVERAPHRSLLRACGFTAEDMKQPLIGVVELLFGDHTGAYPSACPERCGEGRNLPCRRNSR